MTPGEQQSLLEMIDELEPGGAALSDNDAQRRVVAILQPLLSADGYVVEPLSPLEHAHGVDMRATRPMSETHERQNLIVKIKYRGRLQPVTLYDIGQFIVMSSLHHDVPRAIIVANTGFSAQLRDDISRRLPFETQLLTLHDLRSWISRLETVQEELHSQAQLIVGDFARRLVEMVARNPRALDHMEWRDIERVIAEVFDGLGFNVLLTPPAKDGGKDVVLECLIDGLRHSYIVEVKHWRSGKRVGSSAIREFVRVVAREAREGGMFLSTHGYTTNAFETLTEIERKRVRFGHGSKIAALCRTYTRAAFGLWSPPQILADVIFEGTEPGV